MLNHMDCQQFLIECRERRAQRDPNQKQSEKKTPGAPSRNDVYRARTKIKPSAQVQECSESYGQGKRNRSGPGLQCALNGKWHSSVTAQKRSSLGLRQAPRRERETAQPDARFREMKPAPLSLPDLSSCRTTACCPRPELLGG